MRQRQVQRRIVRESPDSPHLQGAVAGERAHDHCVTDLEKFQRDCRVFLARLHMVYGREAPEILRKLADEIEGLTLAEEIVADLERLMRDYDICGLDLPRHPPTRFMNPGTSSRARPDAPALRHSDLERPIAEGRGVENASESFPKCLK